MREIKFRAWDGEEIHQMEELLESVSDTDEPWLHCILRKDDIFEDWILLPFTGLKDLTGKEVYEGDIFTFRCPDCIAEHRAEVIWFEDLASWGLNDHNSQKAPLAQPVFEMSEECDEDCDNDCSQFSGELQLLKIERVIGNIYQNKELLK